MKAEELMIGNLVTFKDCQHDEHPTIVKIWQINGDNEAFVQIDDEEGFDVIDIDNEIVGIPLTPEILEKNGFSKLERSWILKRIGMEICVEFIAEKWSLVIHNKLAPKDEHGRADLVTFCHDWFNGFYVHELQHALRLCGIDKEIVL